MLAPVGRGHSGAWIPALASIARPTVRNGPRCGSVVGGCASRQGARQGPRLCLLHRRRWRPEHLEGARARDRGAPWRRVPRQWRPGARQRCDGRRDRGLEVPCLPFLGDLAAPLLEGEASHHVLDQAATGNTADLQRLCVGPGGGRGAGSPRLCRHWLVRPRRLSPRKSIRYAAPGVPTGVVVPGPSAAILPACLIPGYRVASVKELVALGSAERIGANPRRRLPGPGLCISRFSHRMHTPPVNRGMHNPLPPGRPSGCGVTAQRPASKGGTAVPAASPWCTGAPVGQAARRPVPDSGRTEAGGPRWPLALSGEGRPLSPRPAPRRVPVPGRARRAGGGR